MLAWGRKVPSYRGVPRGGHARVLSVEWLCTSRGGLRTHVRFHPYEGASYRSHLKALQTTHSLHYDTRRITQVSVTTTP